MLDDNLKVLSRRINELELEVCDRDDKLQKSDKLRKDLEDRLSLIHDKEKEVRLRIEDEFREELELKEREARKLREQLQAMEHRHKSEVESMKLAKQQELDVIEEKIKMALSKKHEIIQSLQEEIKLREMQIEKLKVMLDKQRRELLTK
jgi:hypothetical protein